MTTTDAVTHSIAHATLQDDAHLLARIPLRSLHEIATVCSGPRDVDIDWDHIRSTFRRAGAEAALDGYLDLARRLFDARIPSPRRRALARWHSRVAIGLTRHPSLSPYFETVVFQRRQLQRARLEKLYPHRASVWSMRAHHLGAGLRRTLGASRP